MSRGALPNLLVVGAMKCGTTSVHHLLGLHPDIAMSSPKELNFFVGPDRPEPGRDAWTAGNWHRGPGWYAAQFDAAAPVRGESSPGYTSPAHPQAAARIAALVPGARLVYVVRDPVARAVSQYWHHVRDGTERREPEEALLDPGSQYVSRGRYLERLQPFLATGAFDGRITVIAQEDLLAEPRATTRALFAAAGVDDFWCPGMTERHNAAPAALPPIPARLRGALAEALADDAGRLRAFAGRQFAGWSV